LDIQDDAIVDISPSREKFFGRSGRMLILSPITAAALLQKIPDDKVISTDLLQKTLTNQFHVEVTCPATTNKVLKALFKEPTNAVAYWPVVKKNGELLGLFPGSVAAQAERLQPAGLSIDNQGKIPKVSDFSEKLVYFD